MDENSQIENRPTTNIYRFFRFFLSVVSITGSFAIVDSICRSNQVPSIAAIAVLAMFLLIAAGLILMAIDRVFRLHEFRQYRIDLLTILVLTALTSLPLATANLLWRLSAPVDPAIDWPSNPPVIIYGLLAFLFLPLLFIMEFLISNLISRKQPVTAQAPHCDSVLRENPEQ